MVAPAKISLIHPGLRQNMRIRAVGAVIQISKNRSNILKIKQIKNFIVLGTRFALIVLQTDKEGCQ